MEREEINDNQNVTTQEVINDDKPTVPRSYGYGIRHLQILLLFFCMTVGNIARAHIGVSVDAMTDTDYKGNNYHDTRANEFEIIGTLKNINGFEEDESIWNVFRSYEWTKQSQELILGVFFFGYFLMMFPMGMVCQRYGGKIPLQICLLVNGLASLVTPTVAVWGGWKAVCCCRIFQGLSQSGLWPSAHTLLGKWVPSSERATFSSYVYTGIFVGTVLAFQISGFLASSVAGWPSTFWLIGALCIFAFTLLTIFGAASPADHKTISDAEKNFIMGRVDDGKKKTLKTPWKQIFTSSHVWATFTAHASAGICFSFLLRQIPAYMHIVLRFDLKNSGLLSAFLYIASAFTTMGYGALSDFCTNRGIVSLKAARIICNTLAQVGPAFCLVAVSYTDDSVLAVILLMVALVLYAGIYSGCMVNYIDLSQNFSGFLMATGNTLTTLLIFIYPIIVANVVTDVMNRSQWRIIMFILAGIIFFSNAIFVCFMSAETQPWNDIDDEEDAGTEMIENR